MAEEPTAGSREAKPEVELVDIVKDFPGVRAVRGVSFSGFTGEIVAFVGENGAGKSTLMKILAGVYTYGTYSGRLLIEGQERRFRSVRDAEHAGVVFIPQELEVVPALTVAENIYLGREPTRFGLVDYRQMQEEAARILEQFSEELDPNATMSSLGTAQQQVVEISRALSKQAKVIILDEPTSSLSGHEANVLFGQLRRLRGRGICIFYISHRLDEIREIADRVVVLRDGQIVAEGSTNELSADEIVEAMIGRKITLDQVKSSAQSLGRPLMELVDWSVADPSNPRERKVRNVSLDLRTGEILGLFGAVGSGRTELLLSVVGAHYHKTSGNLRVSGVPATIRSPLDALNLGIALLPEDRRRHGLEPFLDVGKNLTLASLQQVSRWGFLDVGQEEALAESQVRSLSITTPSLWSPVTTLSGGNQQKVVLGRGLLRSLIVLLLDEPTRGIDVGAKEEIYDRLHDLAAGGMGILVVSSEALELLRIADRLLVIRAGQIVTAYNAGEVSERELTAAAMGG
jgi:D-xylose transport system ATP-binding protein